MPTDRTTLLRCTIVSLLLAVGLTWSSVAFADYPMRVAQLERERLELAHDLEAGEADVDVLRDELKRRILELARRWMGTRWGLGAPQTKTPGQGKINCGMFVATVLGDAGIVVNRTRLQRQPAELIIKTFSRPTDIARFRNDDMATFLEGVRAMGDGIYIIGLDFHVGLLQVEGDDVRFIHASYVTHTVVNEDAAKAVPITTSKYRVVGKLLADRMVHQWAKKVRFRVKGHW
jgi:hypothetical protein